MSNPVAGMLVGISFILGLLFFAIPMFIMSIIDIVYGARYLNAVDMCINSRTIVSPPVWLIVIGSVSLYVIVITLISPCFRTYYAISKISFYAQMAVLFMDVAFLIFYFIWSVIGAIGHFAASCAVSDLSNSVLATLIIQWISILFAILLFFSVYQN